MRQEIDVEIQEIGARGDGIAAFEGGRRLYVPYTVPGDIVRVRLSRARTDVHTGRIVNIVTPGAGRTGPACRHFGRCGGCALQHLEAKYYEAWKLGLLAQALARHGIEAAQIRSLLVSLPRSRRRADFTAIRRKGDLLLGFNARSSHQVVDLAECPVLAPEIVALTPALRELLLELLAPAESAEVAVTRTDSGLDLLLVTGASLGLVARERLASFAETQDLARLARRHPKGRGSEVLVVRRPVRVRFGDVLVGLPPGGFLQATIEGEAALRRAVWEGVGNARRIADLYAGAGAFGLSLAAEGRRVSAVEVDRQLVEAVEEALRAAAGRLPLKVLARDLERRPLRPDELEDFDAVVFDPPRAGAKTQVTALAASNVPRVVAVSCNPATFARDARTLLDGGYRLDWVQPIDQFLWSPHLELAAAFHRP